MLVRTETLRELVKLVGKDGNEARGLNVVRVKRLGSTTDGDTVLVEVTNGRFLSRVVEEVPLSDTFPTPPEGFKSLTRDEVFIPFSVVNALPKFKGKPPIPLLDHTLIGEDELYVTDLEMSGRVPYNWDRMYPPTDKFIPLDFDFAGTGHRYRGVNRSYLRRVMACHGKVTGGEFVDVLANEGKDQFDPFQFVSSTYNRKMVTVLMPGSASRGDEWERQLDEGEADDEGRV